MGIKFLVLPLGYVLLGALLAAVILAVINQPKLNNKAMDESGITKPDKPSLTDYGYPVGKKSLFDFSPDRQQIALIEDVFAEYGQDYDRYYAIKILDVGSSQEKTILIGDIKLSSYEWLNNDTIRAYLNAGTGVRAYRDILINLTEPVVYKDYVANGLEPHTFWTPDEEYAKEQRRKKEASLVYQELARD